MRLRPAWLVIGCVGCVDLVTACGLSVGGLGDELALDDAGFDATAQGGEGAAPGPDATPDVHPTADASPHPDGGDAGPHDAATADTGDASVDASDASDATLPDAEPSEGGGRDAGEDGDAGAVADASDGGVPCTAGSAGCVIVPAGWSLVAFAPSQSAACPGGFQTPTNLVEGPDAAAACTCSTCSVTTPPSCASGQVGVYYDVAATFPPTCAQTSPTGALHNSPAGRCGGPNGGDFYVGDYSPFDIEYVAPPPSGGACSAPGTATGPVTYAALDRACSPVSPQAAGCIGSACQPSLSGPYAACVMHAGAVACPPGPLGVQHLVGSDVSFGCSACGCTVDGTCTGTVTLYTDTKCKSGAMAFPADGTCNNVAKLANGSTTTFSSYQYAGNAPSDVQCTANGTSAAQAIALTGPSTVCCAQ